MNCQTNYFNFSELTKTSTMMFNEPTTAQQLRNLAHLWDFLNKLRARYGEPVEVNSAFRSPAVNREVGGSRNSWHQAGLAADIRSRDNKKLLSIVYEFSNELLEIIDHQTYIHIAILLPC